VYVIYFPISRTRWSFWFVLYIHARFS